MTPAFELVRRQAQALPLGEQLSLAAELIETARRTLPPPVLAESASSDRPALLREAIGSMRGRLSTVDEFLQEKHAERERENARDVARLRREAA